MIMGLWKESLWWRGESVYGDELCVFGCSMKEREKNQVLLESGNGE